MQLTDESKAKGEPHRFQKGQSGNPGGRPKSGLAALKLMLKNDGDRVAKVVLQKALEGDMAACKLILDRCIPTIKPVAGMISLKLPEGAGIAGTSFAVLQAVAAGELPPDVGAQLIQSITSLARVAELVELERRIQALESQV